MLRDIELLTAHTFDVLVVGGGIYGLIIARDAAQRGLSVGLIEQRDFGSGSSFNHLRTIHGGLRYLQTLNLARARESIRERRTLALIAAPAIRPVPFVLPLPATLTRGPLAMRAGFVLDNILAHDRNRGVPSTHHLPAGEVIGRDEALRRYPPLKGMSFAGAAIWHDYVTTDADRLTLAWGLAAAMDGAVLANYVEARGLTVESGSITAVSAVDHSTKRQLTIATRLVVNATGGGIDGLLAPVGAATRLSMLKAMNLVTRLEAPAHAVGGRTPAGRNLFMVPWRGRALFGTWESTEPIEPTDNAAHERDVEQFIGEINAAFPAYRLARADVTLVHRGVVPARLNPDGSAALEGGEQLHDASARGIQNLISVAGTKYTTARAVAERVVDLALQKLKRPAVPCRTAATTLPISTGMGDARLVEVASEEMVMTLEDAVVRRTPLGALGDPGHAALAHAAQVVGDVLGWSDDKRQRETTAVEQFYGTLKA